MHNEIGEIGVISPYFVHFCTIRRNETCLFQYILPGEQIQDSLIRLLHQIPGFLRIDVRNPE